MTISLKIIAFYPRSYKAIIMDLKQKTYNGFIERILAKIAVTFLERVRKSSVMLRAHCV